MIHLEGVANQWSHSVVDRVGVVEDWAIFRKHYLRNYFPPMMRDRKREELLALRQGT